MSEMYFEDFRPGDRFVGQGVNVTASMIVDFALADNLQPFHPDSRAAAASPLGRLIASGLQTLALGFRVFVQLGLFSACGTGSRVATSCAGFARFVRATGSAPRSKSSRFGLPGPSRTAARC
jgi:acyl dehydratase